MILLALLACSESPTAPPSALPEDLPAGTTRLTVHEGDLRIDEEVVGPLGVLAVDLARSYPPLVERLRGQEGVWVGLPRDTSWGVARQAVRSALEADAGPVWLGDTDPLVGPLHNGSDGIVPITDCGPDGVEIRGVGRRLTVGLHLDGSTRWPEVSVRFLPRVLHDDREVLATLLPDRCWRSASCEQLEGAAREACTATTAEAPDRLPLAGAEGCLVPTAKGGNRWRRTLPGALAHLGLTASTPTLLMPDDAVPYGDVMDFARGLSDHGIRNPDIGLLQLASGPMAPACDEGLRTGAEVARAAGSWYGAKVVSQKETVR